MKIEFISYSGKWPTLCMGTVIFNINGKEITFGASKPAENNFDKFWVSGGSTNWKNGKIYKNSWQLNDIWEEVDEEHPQWIIDILPILLNEFNNNVEYGCCGGCL